MKKYFKVFMVVVLVLTFTLVLTGCGEEEITGGGTAGGGGTIGGSKTYSFPTASFIPSGMEYTGSGTIMYSATKESISPKQAEVYITGAKVEDVVDYVQTLKSKGLKNANAYKEEQTGFNEYGSYSWIGVNDEDSFSLSVVLSEEETELNLVEGTYNLLISMADENPYAE